MCGVYLLLGGVNHGSDQGSSRSRSGSGGRSGGEGGGAEGGRGGGRGGTIGEGKFLLHPAPALLSASDFCLYGVVAGCGGGVTPSFCFGERVLSIMVC